MYYSISKRYKNINIYDHFNKVGTIGVQGKTNFRAFLGFMFTNNIYMKQI